MSNVFGRWVRFTTSDKVQTGIVSSLPEGDDSNVKVVWYDDYEDYCWKTFPLAQLQFIDAPAPPTQAAQHLDVRRDALIRLISVAAPEQITMMLRMLVDEGAN